MFSVQASNPDNTPQNNTPQNNTPQNNTPQNNTPQNNTPQNLILISSSDDTFISAKINANDADGDNLAFAIATNNEALMARFT